MSSKEKSGKKHSMKLQKICSQISDFCKNVLFVISQCKACPKIEILRHKNHLQTFMIHCDVTKNGYFRHMDFLIVFNTQ